MQWVAHGPERLDAFLAAELTEISRARVQTCIVEGAVTVNGEVIQKSSYRLSDGDKVELTASLEPERVNTTIEPKNLHLHILYEDDACMVIAKPYGLTVHPAQGVPVEEATLLHGIAYIFAEQQIPFSPDAVLVHRLDKETTGCILVAKTPDAHAALQKQFEQRTVQKKYLAIVYGMPDPPAAKIDAPIGRNLTDRTKMSVLRTSTSREAQTTYTTMDATHESALLLCDLHTGRTHQIRVHLRSINHPILGDDKYGSPHSEEFTALNHIETMCLHAWRLSFHSPTGADVAMESPIPAPFLNALATLTLELQE